MTGMALRLTVLTPTRRLVETMAARVLAEAPDGAFAILPRHADLLTRLAPGLMICVTPEGRERFFGLDEGVLVKQGCEVRASVLAGFESDDLAGLRARVHRDFIELDEAERTARSALARLEAGAIRRVLEIER